MPSHEERALEIVEFDDALQALTDEQIDRLQETIAEALRTVRREALEEAAKVASAWDLCRSVYDGNGNLCESTAGSRIAQAIRALGKESGS